MNYIQETPAYRVAWKIDKRSVGIVSLVVLQLWDLNNGVILGLLAAVSIWDRLPRRSFVPTASKPGMPYKLTAAQPKTDNRKPQETQRSIVFSCYCSTSTQCQPTRSSTSNLSRPSWRVGEDFPSSTPPRLTPGVESTWQRVWRPVSSKQWKMLKCLQTLPKQS